MRERSTWQGKDAATPRQAATHRQADIYTMNQEHPQPTPIDYESGDPDSWAESWHGYGDVEQEYEAGHVKRNELNFAEMLDNTYKHKDSDHWHSGKGTYDNVKDGEGKFENTSGKSTGEKPGRTYEAGSRPATPAVAGDRRDMAEKKAKAVERITRAMLRTSNEKIITDVAIGFMGMPDRVVVSALKALDAVSPDALPIENKTRRALACTKLAVQLIGDSSEKAVETLASTIMSIDDPTLKAIMAQVATARIAQEQEQEEEQEGSHTSQQEEQDQGGAPPAPPPPAPPAAQGQQQQQGQKMMPAQQQMMGQQEQQGQQQMMSQEEQLAQQLMAQQEQAQQQMMGQQQQQGQECGDEMGMPHMGNALPPAELQMLDQMLKEEMGQQGCPPGDDLQALFEAAPVPVAPAAPVAPVMASQGGQGGLDISFDDDEEEGGVPAVASDNSELDNLFADNDEVQAQRQIAAAAQEQAARESGFSTSRTASTRGAKKIGQVQRGKPATIDAALESLWERP
jgi:hypothetical protein